MKIRIGDEVRFVVGMSRDAYLQMPDDADVPQLWGRVVGTFASVLWACGCAGVGLLLLRG